jgi:hypothetical protein
MPLGKVSSGDFRKGTPIVLPHQFGTPVGSPEPQGNVIPQSNPTLDSNPVTWVPSPSHFGNKVGFSMQSVPPIVIIQQGGTGSVNVNLTDLLGGPYTVTLSFSGAPAGVAVSFAPNPATGTTTSVAELTVAANVPTGKYTITITGVSGTETETTNIHLIVFNQSLPSNAFGFLLEDGSGVLLLEDGTVLLLENQS